MNDACLSEVSAFSLSEMELHAEDRSFSLKHSVHEKAIIPNQPIKH